MLKATTLAGAPFPPVFLLELIFFGALPVQFRTMWTVIVGVVPVIRVLMGRLAALSEGFLFSGRCAFVQGQKKAVSRGG